MSYIIPFEKLRMSDVASVGGKNASLGEMISQLSDAGVRVPSGFATTAHAFRDFLSFSSLDKKISEKLRNLNPDNIYELSKAGSEIRNLIMNTPFSEEFESSIRSAFETLDYDGNGSFAVRSSATAEDLPDASFAGQQETFLNVVGIVDILDKIKHVFASLYNDRAISYRVHKGYDNTDVALSAGIQRMVRSDKGSAGVMFTIDTESGFSDVVFITSSYGLGETVVQGAVNPDEFYVFKPSLAKGLDSILSRRIGSKLIKMEFNDDNTIGSTVRTVDVSLSDRNKYSLNDHEVTELAKYAVIIERHYGRPMDIEWGRDGIDGKIYILQARPETVQSQQVNKDVQKRYKLKATGKILISGRAIGQKIGSGPVKVVFDTSEIDRVQKGDVLVTDMTDPNWEPVMKRASAIVTNRGGRTCHAAIIARELGIPAVVGCGDATNVLKDGQSVTVSCSEGDEGYIYDGLIETEIEDVSRGEMPTIDLKIMMNVGNPQLAFDFSQLPNSGVGLARLEFIINNNIGVHPKAVLDYPNLDNDLKKAVESSARGYSNPRGFFVEKMAEGISTIAAAFWPKPVIVRLSDFKSNEYRKLIGGSRYEPEEENPMLGFRGASRYIAENFNDCFLMECKAFKKVRNDMGLTNVEIMVPFVRTVNQAKKVIELLSENGLKRGENGLRIIMMCEVPSNAILAEKFLDYFDGFSIGSNDMTQLTLGLDRDSGMELLAADFDERDEAVKFMLHRAIQSCIKSKKYIGICGQGPSDHPDFAKWLHTEGISSISLNPDTVVDTWQRLAIK
ncbi:pyruvate, water dikinase [Candidatus Kinetoplastibacterium blastocrithidii TCC012E]|uniref:Phosphoenolpyruvate synthase n=1 Tax=Candidatus Kinetoplastidibacterium blastocrithidiae TCC012E TaxID=1208922 RepID=M1MDG9_9PROT|nr:phosphoenolpyruvate synthase [Candidatus Kinetoplastibacterium blastocrithidii]AGF49765.1 pyruvate, water dikinase [Candidatus Kinetoplastibacterium blastocrithidii TCC012E]